MGYYTRQDIPIHYLLADAFTVCDRYFCSVLGPTLPNRLYWLSATIDPDGQNGGPELQSPTFQPVRRFGWRIMPQNLSDAGVSWKVYRNKTLVNRPGMSGDSSSWKGWGHVRWFIEEVPAGAA
ncbi:Phospholipase C 4 (MTP40 antigen) (part1) [Mycobacterium tuberculosis]|nr:Phospholipase C 4 (MTP40 antigen) (part1) [Mycobacterium tuberculosis]CLX14153.1 Phospholipase C 4 (MTP40 antigen) (part1) [Mycobacterium tuberculosis]CMN41641.1 Phospholipase C 4 (MTP40 antigen) (part1) [Mycobacterium tuberculosis]CMN64577.1 Phospholipase C 4 (MTP40 antigen) (part1) [Mycobacterium tuberculosis]CMP31639.1 Phospholipase C 4 (MTP40 antigen) (part1) [Mycobacterium tuberculosis]